MNSRERQIVFLTKECWILMHPPNNDDNDIIIRINQQLEGRKTSILLTLNFINFPLSECHWVNLARKTLKINHHYSHFFFIIVFHVVFFLSWFFRSQREFMRPNYSLSGSSGWPFFITPPENDIFRLTYLCSSHSSSESELNFEPFLVLSVLTQWTLNNHRNDTLYSWLH